MQVSGQKYGKSRLLAGAVSSLSIMTGYSRGRGAEGEVRKSKVVPSTGIEPVTFHLGGGRSIQLSYEGIRVRMVAGWGAGINCFIL